MTRSVKIFGLVVAQGINAIINFLFLPYLVRALTSIDYGTYGQVLLITDTARTFFSLGLSTVLYVSLPKAKDPENDFKELFITSILLGVVSGVGIMAFSGPLGDFFGNPLLTPLLSLYGPHLFFAIPYLILNALLIYQGRVRESLILFTIGLLIRVTFIVTGIEVFDSLPIVFGLLSLLAFIQFLLILSVTQRSYIRFTGKNSWNLGSLWRKLALGAQLGFTELMGFAMAYTDKILVSTFLGVREFAIYRNGTIEIPILGTLYTSVAAIILPVVSAYYMKSQFGEIAKLKKKIIVLTAAVIYPVVLYLIVFNHSLVTLYFSTAYAESALVFGIISIGLLFRVNDYMDILISSGKGRVLMMVYFIGFVFNLLLGSVLISEFGYIGAAASTVLSYFLLLSSLLILSARTLNLPIGALIDYGKLFGIFAISLGLALFGKLIWISPLFAFIPQMIGLVVIFLFCTMGGYFIFFKFHLADYADLSPLVRRIPGIGVAIDPLLNRYFRRATR